MAEDTTTAEAGDQQGAEDQQVTTGTPPADPQATESQTGNDNADNLDDTSKSTGDGSAEDNKSTEQKTEGTPASFDADLDQWAEKTGRPVPTTDYERSLLQDVRNSQREFSREKAAKKAAEALDKSTAEQKPATKDDEYVDPLEKGLDDVKDQLAEERAIRARSEYFNQPEIRDSETLLEETTEMGVFLKEEMESASSDKERESIFNYWTNPRNTAKWHRMAKARLTDSVDTSAIQEEAARKERERIERESRAGGPSGNASQHTTTEKTEDEKRLERFSNWD